MKPGKLHDALWKATKELKQDYEPYGKAERDNEDCSCGCKFYQPLQSLPSDWGVCINPKSRRRGLLTFEHQGCRKFKAGKKKGIKEVLAEGIAKGLKR